MRLDRTQAALGVVLLSITAAVALWQNPGWWRAPIDQTEAHAYLDVLRALPLPVAFRDEIMDSAAQFMEHDDGGPVYMLNLMRLHRQLAGFDGAPDFTGN